jgi:hypothetical protein
VGLAVNVAALIAEQARRVHLDPTEPQKEAGNYRKGHVRVHGLPISIENPKDSVRTGVGADGKAWQSRLPAHYGYIKRTEGADGDHVDCYIGPHHRSPLVYVVDQRDPDSQGFDEHKVLLGFASPKQARATYEAAFSDGSGKRRMGHLTEITMSQFKDWLRDGDTKTPYKRQHGGRIPRADGGKLMSDDEVGILTDADVGITPMKEDRGALPAFGRGAAQGLYGGWADEYLGSVAASGMKDRPAIPFYPTAQSAVGAVKYLAGDEDARRRYDEKVKAEREEAKTAQEQHPYASVAGEVTGALPTMMAMPEAAALKAVPTAGRAINFLRSMGRGAQVGAEYGAIHGAGSGETPGERVTGAAGEGVTGGAFGALAPIAGKIAGAAYDKFGRPIASVIRGLWNPEGESARRLAAAIFTDTDLILRGQAKGMTPSQWVAAKRAGEPVTIADMGSTNVQALLRSAANTSAEGRARLEKMVEDKFLSQNERVAADVRGLVAGGANAGKTADQLVAEYDLARVPAYKQSYHEGDKSIMTPTMERLMGSPTFVDAMKGAISSGKDRAVKDGYGAFNPAVTVENGMIKFTGARPGGVPTYPNLQYWDAVKKELDSMASQAQRKGDTNAGVYEGLAKTLRDELDTVVPSYANTRGIAAQFFGERDALTAGRKLAGKRVDPDDLKKVMRQMKPDERELFQEGYASDLAGRVIGDISQTRDITKAIFNSPNERARIEAVFGPAGINKLEARMALETFMDGARRAMGNSTTARQLAEMGLAGGAVEGGYNSGWNPQVMLTHGLIGAAVAPGLATAAGQQAVSSMRRVAGYVDLNTATNVAKLLTSSDPTQLAQGIAIAAKNQKVLQALKDTAVRTAVRGAHEWADPSAGAAALLPKLQGAAPARAENEQQ